MTLLFRMVVEDDRDNLLDSATGSVTTWLKQKNYIAELPPVGQRVATDSLEMSTDEVEDDHVAVRRHTVSEDQATGRWTTTVTAMTTPDGRGWLWVDLERVSDDPWGKAPDVAIPGLVRTLLMNGTAHVGTTPLPAEAIIVSTGSVEALVKVLQDPERAVPVVVLSRDYVASTLINRQRADTLTRELRGVAPVYVLEGSATSELNSVLGPGLHVIGGAVRTYLPGMAHAGPLLRRHRVLGSSHLRADLSGAARLVAEPLRRQALATSPPAMYRTHGRLLLRRNGSSVDEDALLIDLLAAEQATVDARIDAAELQEALDWQALAEADTERTLDQAMARLRWLESLLAEQGQHVQGESAPEQDRVKISGFEDVLSASKTHLNRIVLGDVAGGALALDQYPQAESWARKAWRALMALDQYAENSAKGWSGDFRAWCVTPPAAAASVPVSWVSLRESDSVDNNPKYRDARTLTVPNEADPDGQVYMPAHIKIVEGGRPAPRIHFHDDSSGPTGKIYVGHLGPHLPNDQTN